MTRTALICVGLLAFAARGQESSDAGLELQAADAGLESTPTAVELVPTVAVEPPAEPTSGFLHKVEANGYLSVRGGFTRSKTNGLISTEDQPQLTGLAELNGQLKVSFVERSFLYADVSLVAAAAGNYRGTDKDGHETIIADHDAAANRPLVSINELYALHEFRPELNLMLGKKRLVWGSGQAYNPTDLINVRKDPTDPTFQRSGAWLARLEVPLEKFVITAVVAPSLLKQISGVPQQFLIWPGWDQKDTQLHYLAALRGYALIADADINLMLFYSNLFGDSFTNKVRLGGSFSRYFFTNYELHTEFLIQSGSSRDFITPECVVSAQAALACNGQKVPFIGKTEIEGNKVVPKILVGTRSQFDDESFLSIEYLYQGDGYTRSQYQDFVNALDLVQQAKALGVPANQIPNLNPTTTTDGLPQRFNFEPLVQHYLFLTYSKPRIFDDFTAQLVTLVNLQDLSTLWTPSIAWSTTDWMTLSVIGFIPVRGPDSMAATQAGTGKRISEYQNLPMAYRVLLEARVFY